MDCDRCAWMIIGGCHGGANREPECIDEIIFEDEETIPCPR